MDSQSGESPTRMTSDPVPPPERIGPKYEFVQAVRILEESFARRGREERRPPAPIGTDGPPRSEAIRFRSVSSLDFPESDIESVAESDPDREDERSEMTVTFLGLTGPNGVLPHHYTRLVLNQLQSEHHSHTLKDFLDLFSHRAISFFWRAINKYRLPLCIESSKRRDSEGYDPITLSMLSLVGLGEKTLQHRQSVPDTASVYYGGHFAHSPRNAVSLEAVLSDYFQLTVQVKQFRGRWLSIEPRDQSRMSSVNAGLGTTLVCGTRQWDISSMFTVCVGPMRYAEFDRLYPGTDAFRELSDIVRTYAGLQYDFDVECCLFAEEVPWMQLGGSDTYAPRLGWNTWVRNREFDANVSATFQSGSHNHG